MLLKSLLALFRPKIEVWIRTRALTVPAPKRAEFSKILGVSEEALRFHEILLAEYALTQIDRIL